MNELKALSDSARFYPVCLFYGAESFLVSDYSRRLVNNANNVFGMADFNFAELEGDKVDTEQLCDLIEAMPMFADQKCILLKDYPAGSLNDDDFEMFISCIENMPDTTVLVMTYSNTTIDARTKKWSKLLETVKNKGKIAVCDTPNREELAIWIERMAKMLDASIERSSAYYLIERIGSDMRKIRTEMPKIAAYAAGEILPSHIDAVAVKQLDAGVYDMVGDIASRRFTSAYSRLDELMQMGQEPQMILGAIAGAFADIYIAKLAKRYKVSPQDVMTDFDYKQNAQFRVRNAMRDESRYSDAYLCRCIRLTDDADRKLKSFSTDEKLVLEELIASIAAGRADG